MQRAEASLARAKATARNAAADYTRVRALYENRNASRTDLDEARAGAEASRAEVASATKDLELARLQLAYTKLASPAACSVATVPVEVNENILAGVSTITEVICGSRLEVEVSVPEVFIARVQKGSTVEVTFDAIPGLRFSATRDQSRCRIRSNRYHLPGHRSTASKIFQAFVLEWLQDVTFHFKSKKGRATNSCSAQWPSEKIEKGRYVFVVEATEDGFGLVHRKPVTVGELTAEGLEILDGLSDGERLVTAGVRRLNDGRKVRLMDSPQTSS